MTFGVFPSSPFLTIVVNDGLLSGCVIVIVCVPLLLSVTVTSGVNPSFPFSPLSPFGPLMFPSFSQVLPFLTNTSPLSVFTYLSPSLPSVVGSTFPFSTSFPSRPFCPAGPCAPSRPSRPGRPCAPSCPRSP